LSEWATGLSIPVKPVKGQIVLTERLPKLLNGCLTTSDCYMAQKDNGEILIGSTTEDKGFDVNTFPEIVGWCRGHALPAGAGAGEPQAHLGRAAPGVAG
jgi:hydrogen cyanide synthase HcnC